MPTEPHEKSFFGINYASLGECLRDGRLKLDFSLRDLSKRTGISPSFLQRMETGQNEFSLEKFFVVSACIGRQPTELLRHNLEIRLAQPIVNALMKEKITCQFLSDWIVKNPWESLKWKREHVVGEKLITKEVPKQSFHSVVIEYFVHAILGYCTIAAYLLTSEYPEEEASGIRLELFDTNPEPASPTKHEARIINFAKRIKSAMTAKERVAMLDSICIQPFGKLISLEIIDDGELFHDLKNGIDTAAVWIWGNMFWIPEVNVEFSSPVFPNFKSKKL